MTNDLAGLVERVGLEVAKVNRRLIIRDAATWAVVYDMPSFLRPVRDRSVLYALAKRLEAGGGIAAIAAFETAHNPRALAKEKHNAE